jgi:hypothetical protein
MIEEKKEELDLELLLFSLIFFFGLGSICIKKMYRIIDLDRRKIRSETLLFSLFFFLA